MQRMMVIVFCILPLALLQILLPSPARAESGRNGGPSECVVLLHGLARSSASMDTMADGLRERGFSVANIDYPSREKPIYELAAIAVQDGINRCRAGGATRIHFVTHSLGGILVRAYLKDRKISEMGRVVMLAPPNQGSRVVDEFSAVPGYDILNGPAGHQLGKDAHSVPLQLGPAHFEVGIIAGDRTVNPILSTAFTEPNDGKVAVADTRLEGMKDFLVVHHSHPFIMESDEVIEQTAQFLKQGRFRREGE